MTQQHLAIVDPAPVIYAGGYEAPHFDYSTLPAADAQKVQAVRDRIRVTYRAAIIECGQLLNGIKEKLPHGQFGPWCEAELGFSARTARNYMLAAEVFAGKTATIATLPPGALYAAAGAPPEVRDDIVRRTDAGEKLNRLDVANLIAQHQADRREEKRKTSQKAVRQARAKARAEGRHNKMMERWRQEQAQEEAARREAASELIDQLRTRWKLTEIEPFVELLKKTQASDVESVLRERLQARTF